MKKLGLMLVFALSVLLLLPGCGTTDNTAGNEQEEPVVAESLPDTAAEVVLLLKNKDFSGLSEKVHPEKGVRFSSYAFVDIAKDKVFSAEDVSVLADDTQTYNWGNYDGSGEPIQLDFNGYYEKFVYDQDFANAEKISENEIIGSGTTTNNIKEAYPDGSFTEYHFTGFDPQYEGMDWVSLRLVFEKIDQQWYLVGIVHDQWTI